MHRISGRAENKVSESPHPARRGRCREVGFRRKKFSLLHSRATDMFTTVANSNEGWGGVKDLNFELATVVSGSMKRYPTLLLGNTFESHRLKRFCLLRARCFRTEQGARCWLLFSLYAFG